MVGWREYQERVADLLRELGCTAEVEASVQGVRANHDIDVWVAFERFGLEHRWCIECVYCNTLVHRFVNSFRLVCSYGGRKSRRAVSALAYSVGATAPV